MNTLWIARAGRMAMVTAAALVTAMTLGTGCFRNTTSEIELKIPAMRTEACAKEIQAGLAKLGDAVSGFRYDLETHTAWVKFDNVRLGRRNVEVAVSHAGFAVNDWPADEAVRDTLAEECR